MSAFFHALRLDLSRDRHGLKRAMRSLERYPLPVTTEKEACALEGVGSFTARRMLRGLSLATGGGNKSSSNSSSRSRGTGQGEENIEPTQASSSSSAGSARGRSKQASNNSSRAYGSSFAMAAGCCSSSNNNKNGNGSSMLKMNFCPDGASHSHGTGAAKHPNRPLWLASNFAALRGNAGGDDGGGAQTPDVTPKRPTSRARREEVGDGVGLSGFSSKAPRLFSGEWEAWLIVDNREHDFMSMQVSLIALYAYPCK